MKWKQLKELLIEAVAQEKILKLMYGNHETILVENPKSMLDFYSNLTDETEMTYRGLRVKKGFVISG